MMLRRLRLDDSCRDLLLLLVMIMRTVGKHPIHAPYCTFIRTFRPILVSRSFENKLTRLMQWQFIVSLQIESAIQMHVKLRN